MVWWSGGRQWAAPPLPGVVRMSAPVCGVIRASTDFMLRYLFACGGPRYGNFFRVSAWGLRPGVEFTRRQFDRRRKHVRLRIRIHAGPWRLAAEMRLGEVPFAPDIEQVFDSVEVEKERVAAAAGEKSVGARLDDIRSGAEGDFGVG